MKIYFDGGCKPNPGRIVTAVVAGGRVWHRADHGSGDNNDAEWIALLEALTIARDLSLSDVTLLGDSATVFDHANEASRRRTPRFDEYLVKFRALSSGLERLRIRRIARTQNLAGIALARLAVPSVISR